MAKETQKAKIERLEKEIDMWREMCSKMEKELTEFREMADNSFEKSSTYIQYSKRIEMLISKVHHREEFIHQAIP